MHPTHEISLSSENSVEIPSMKIMERNLCLLQQSCEDCLCLIDNVGNRFCVNLFGEYDIVKKQENPLKCKLYRFLALQYFS